MRSPLSDLTVLYSPSDDSIAAGAPLTLSHLSTSTFFHPSSRPSFFSPSSANTDDGRRVPFLSQADHPATGRPAWFVHPCETEAVVKEVLEETKKNEGGVGGVEAKGERWLRTWLMVVSSVVDLRE